MDLSISISQQLLEAGTALALGAATGCLFDFFRCLGRKLGRFTRWIADVLTALVFCMGLFVLAFTLGGGELRLFMVLLAGCGAILYFCLLSWLFMKIWGAIIGSIFYILHILAIPFQKPAAGVKKFCKKLKNRFPSLKKWYTIRNTNKVR